MNFLSTIWFDIEPLASNSRDLSSNGTVPWHWGNLNHIIHGRAFMFPFPAKNAVLSEPEGQKKVMFNFQSLRILWHSYTCVYFKNVNKDSVWQDSQIHCIY